MIQKIYHRGKTINRVYFSDIEHCLDRLKINVNSAFEAMADDNEVVYVSNGFLAALGREEAEPGEWHHYFKTDGAGSFDAFRLNFSTIASCNNVAKINIEKY